MYYPVTPSRRATNALVVLEAGTGTDPAALARALKMLRKEMDASGTYRLLRRQSHLFQFYRPGERRRMKSEAARARERKAAMKQARRDAEPAGTRRRPAPRKVVVPTTAA